MSTADPNPSSVPADAILRANALIVLGNFPNPAPIVVIAKHAGTTESDLTAAMQGSPLFHLIDSTELGKAVELTDEGWQSYHEQFDDDEAEAELEDYER